MRWKVVAVAVLLLGASRARVRADDPPAPPPKPAPAVAPEGPDAIDDALAKAGISRRDLGWNARGWWDRYPQDVPHEMRHVRDLFREPLATIPWLRSLGRQAKEGLTPEGLAKKGSQGAGRLMTLVHDLGVHRRYGATRPYSANLAVPPVPLDAALKALYVDAKRPTTPVVFGKPVDFPRLEKDLAGMVAPLPPAISAHLGALVGNLVDAQHWADLAWRRVSLETRAAVHARLDAGVEGTDAQDYEPAFDDAAREWDEASLWYAGLKVVEALDVAREALAPEVSKAGASLTTFRLDVPTPRGRIVVLGTGDDAFDVGSEGAFLVVDLGGNDRHGGSIAASTPTRPIGAALDLGGDDVYDATDRAQGAGSVGVGVLLDAAGKDRYTAKGTLSQGAAIFGLGVLADLAGDDEYFGAYGSQGGAWFGVGVLLDAAGKDRYVIWSDGQGFAGAAGVGVLADGSGDDSYEAVVDSKVTGRPSYHTKDGAVTVSNAQGCGMGRRGDGSDGHSWAGGVGMLLDGGGKDTYVAANWCQGCGYWFGTGLLWDADGDDEYRANGWAGGSGAHFCIGCHVDEAGNDLHRVTQNWGPGYGHDFTVGISVDLGGNDRYEAGESGIGWSINRSVALLLDAGGDDTYRFAKPEPRPGTAVFDERFLDRSGKTALYWTEPTSVGLFLDVGGTDSYPDTFGDDRAWTLPPESENARARNFGIAVDRAEGRLDLDRPASRPRR